jgi:translation initiation factor 2-alpha kinase 3
LHDSRLFNPNLNVPGVLGHSNRISELAQRLVISSLGNADSQNLQVYIIPHIGDFGLIARLEDSNNLSVPPSSTSKPFKPSPIAVLSSVASSRQPGTRFYCAPDTAARVICPKLDIYSLGVIMVEMLWEFGTKTERHVVLGELAKGVMPAGLGDHALEPAVKGMLEKEREKRWDCARVRQFLQGLL